ncbi:MAG: hypothetical protein N2114_06345, partial [Candidatus Goldbacteria bacterium]|nr:hypothetical protein [Candidatus Goldiibacteriota bacterium]
IFLNLPANNTQINNIQNINFNFTVIDDYSSTLNCSIYLDGILNQTNNSVINNTLTNFYINGIQYGPHYWYINCTDGILYNTSEIRYFTINDTKAPEIYFVSPSTLSGTYAQNFIEANITAYDENLDKIVIYLFNTSQLIETKTSSSHNYFYNFTNLKPGTYYLNASANDTYGNKNNTETRTIILNYYINWSNPQINTTNIYYNSYIKFNASWFSQPSLAGYIFSHNQSGVWVNSSYIPFSGNSNISEYILHITANSGTIIGWYFWANNTLGIKNSTQIQTIEVKNQTTSLFVSVDKDVYPQGFEPGFGYDVYIPVQARYLDSSLNPISGAECYLKNNITSNHQILMIYNSSTGNYTANLDTSWLYGDVLLTVMCSKPNFDFATNNTTTKVWLYLYLWETELRPYSTNLYNSTWLSKKPTEGSIANLTFEFLASQGENRVRSFYLYTPGINGSMYRNFIIYDNHTLRLNVSVNDTTCKPFLCSKITDFYLNTLIESCANEVTIPANTPSLIESYLTGNYTISQNTYYGIELRLNCTSQTNIKTQVFYNYSGMNANVFTEKAVPRRITTKTVHRIQLEPNYTIGPNQAINITRKSWITFNNTDSESTYEFYYHLSNYKRIDNIVIPNTTYIYNSTGHLWASDNTSAGAPKKAIVYPDNRIFWVTEIIPGNTAINETLIRGEKNAINNTEYLINNIQDFKKWNITLKTIYNEIITIENLTVWTNYSYYNVNSSWIFNILKVKNEIIENITNYVEFNHSSGIIIFPKTNISTEPITYIVTAQYDTKAPEINFIYPTEESDTIINRNYIQINISAYDLFSGLKNISIYLYNSSKDLINYTNSTNSPLFINFTNLSEGIYYFNATAYDNYENMNSTETRNVTVYIKKLRIFLNLPANNTQINNIQNINFNFTVIDDYSSTLNCSIYLDGILNQTN